MNSSYLTLVASSTSLGRYWIASKDIPSGSLILQEKPFISIACNKASFIDPLSICQWCCCLFDASSDSLSSDFCSAECQKVRF